MYKSTYLFTILLVTLSLAALPPQEEKKRKLGKLKTSFVEREKCNNVINIEIISHNRKEGKEDGCPATAKSKIIAVVRQIKKSTLTYGDTITIKYEDKIYRCPSPISYIPKKVEEGKTYQAYLKHVKKDIYTIAAGPWSFHNDAQFIQEFPDKHTYFEVMRMVKKK